MGIDRFIQRTNKRETFPKDKSPEQTMAEAGIFLRLLHDQAEGSTALYPYTGKQVSLSWSDDGKGIFTTLCVKTDQGVLPYLTVYVNNDHWRFQGAVDFDIYTERKYVSISQSTIDSHAADAGAEVAELAVYILGKVGQDLTWLAKQE